jgi:phospholipid transport system substrate-binding protein
VGFLSHCTSWSTKSYRSGAACVIATAAWLSAGNIAVAETPAEIVRGLHEAVLTEMKESNARPLRERYERLVSSVARYFHVPFMMERVVAGRWRDASEDGRKDLVEAFTRINLIRYASVMPYGAGAFEVLGQDDLGPVSFVYARFVRPDATVIPITYKFVEVEPGWRIVDVALPGGMSELAARKSEYRYQLRRGGVAGLTGHLNGISDRLLPQREAPDRATAGAAPAKEIAQDFR